MRGGSPGGGAGRGLGAQGSSARSDPWAGARRPWAGLEDWAGRPWVGVGARGFLARPRVAGFPAWGGARGSRARVSFPLPTPSPAAPRRSLPWGARSRPARLAVLSQGPLLPGPQTRSGSPALGAASAGRAMVEGSQVSEAGPPGSRGEGARAGTPAKAVPTPWGREFSVGRAPGSPREEQPCQEGGFSPS